MSVAENLFIAPPILDMEAVAAKAEDIAYTYQRSDGIIERANSAEDAIARCPVLGKLAIEAPDQANMLLELSVAGSEKMQADKQQENLFQQEKPKLSQKPEPKIEAASASNVIKSEQQLTKNPIYDTSPPRPKLEERPDNELHLLAIQRKEQNDTLAALFTPDDLADRIITAKQQVKPISIVRRKTSTKPQAVSVQNKQRVNPKRAEAYIHPQRRVASSEKLFVSKPKSEQLSKVASFAAPIPELVSARFENEVIQTPPETIADIYQQVAEAVDTDGAPLPSEFMLDLKETVPAEEPEVKNVDWILEDYRDDDIDYYPPQLQAAPIKELDKSEAAIALNDALNVLSMETAQQENIRQDFKSYLAIQPKISDVPSLETIVENADEQSLEQTFAQLAQCLSGALTTKQNNETANTPGDILPEQSETDAELKTIIQDIAEILPACFIVNEASGEQHFHVTPGLSQKLLKLLYCLGYNQPQEALLEFVRARGLVFLMQALQYFCHMGSADEHQTFPVSAITSIDASNIVGSGSILGHMALRFLNGHLLARLIARQT